MYTSPPATEIKLPTYPIARIDCVAASDSIRCVYFINLQVPIDIGYGESGASLWEKFSFKGS